RQDGRWAGGAEASRRAARGTPMGALPIEYWVASRGPERSISPPLGGLGIGPTVYGVCSRGLLTGSRPSERSDFRSYLPRFTGDHKGKNDDVVAAFARFAQERGMTPGQLAIAWVRARQPTFVALVGAKTRTQLDDAL